MNRARNRLFLGIVFVSGILLIGRAGCFYTKGMVAQHLLEKAWRLSKVNGKVVKPWGWADTHPVGKIRIPAIGLDQVILEGTHTESLAFGPAHLSGTPKPGEPGNICIAGHRDSFFRKLDELSVGDLIELESKDGRTRYKVTWMIVTDSDNTKLLGDTFQDYVTLITCYPFDFVGPAHLSGTPKPGEPGNICIAGHRDSFFRKLDELSVGDLIELESKDGRTMYKVTWIIVTDSENTKLLEDTFQDYVTLVTCYPFDFVGPAQERYIVRARMERA